MNKDRSKFYLKSLKRKRSTFIEFSSRPNLIFQIRFHLRFHVRWWVPLIMSGSRHSHFPPMEMLIKSLKSMDQNRLLNDLPNGFSWLKTTTWCHQIDCRRLERKIMRKNNFTIVVTTFISAIFWALYTEMEKQNIFRIRLKR